MIKQFARSARDGCTIGVSEIEESFEMTGWDAKKRKSLRNWARTGCAGCGYVPLCALCWKHWDHAARRCKPERDFREQCGVTVDNITLQPWQHCSKPGHAGVSK